ncbi:hypothetical protein [Microvirga zambiensis]|uniref:hypothetical protein n=1 Tax=Microvirga zambiensis TaxID=1402137 RepID=UPI00191CC83C|nr:hypothetical protein [Microvirga zambiensis]
MTFGACASFYGLHFRKAGNHPARKRFHAFLKAPLTEEAEHLTRARQLRVTHWTTAGLALSGVSIICFASWLVAGTVS